MQWSPGAHAGFSPPATESTWLPVHPNHLLTNVETEMNDPGSRLALYRRLLRLRRVNPALHSGAVEVQPSVSEVVAYRRSHTEGEPFVIAANLSNVEVKHAADGEVVVSNNHELEGRPYRGELEPWEAVVVRPDA